MIATTRERIDKLPEPSFVRGDVNADGSINATDAVSLLSYLFRAGAAPDCAKSADTDDSGTLSITDAIGILRHIFGGAGPLPEPFAGCGVDTSADEVTCEAFAACPG